MMTKRFALALLAALAVELLAPAPAPAACGGCGRAGAFRSRVRPHPFGRVLFHRHL
jgi:hypothetical protein